MGGTQTKMILITIDVATTLRLTRVVTMSNCDSKTTITMELLARVVRVVEAKMVMRVTMGGGNNYDEGGAEDHSDDDDEHDCFYDEDGDAPADAGESHGDDRRR